MSNPGAPFSSVNAFFPSSANGSFQRLLEAGRTQASFENFSAFIGYDESTYFGLLVPIYLDFSAALLVQYPIVE